MTKEEAQLIAKAYLASESAAAGVDFEVIEAQTIEKPFGWVFFYDTRAYLATGDELARAVGNAPFIVARSSGEVEVTGTARPVEYYISNYERFGSCNPSGVGIAETKVKPKIS